MKLGGNLGATALSLLLLAVFLGLWHVGTRHDAGQQTVDPEYAKLVGAQAATGQKSAMPGPAEVGAKLWQHLKDPFYDRGSNDKGIGVQLAYSIDPLVPPGAVGAARARARGHSSS